MDMVTAAADVSQDQTRHLDKVLRWWDGVTINMAMPAALFVSLGYAIVALGAWGAILLWAIAAGLAVLHNWCYSEVASMFPNKSGGISLYANEAWKRFTVFIGPLATFGYWFAWSSSLAIYGLLIGSLIQAQWFPHSTWSWFTIGSVHFGLVQLIAIVTIIVGWVLNVLGIRPAVWVMYAMCVLLAVPVISFGIFAFTDWTSKGMTFSISYPGVASWQVAVAWLFVMSWSVFGIEATASFVPEFKDTIRDTRLALRVSALLVFAIYILVPLGVSGLAGEKMISANPGTFYVDAFQKLTGGASSFMTVCIIGGLVLLMLMTSADCGRVLSQASRDRLTIKGLAKINRFDVPGRAMTLDLILNVILVLVVGNTLSLVVIGNFGYILMHVFAVSGLIILRVFLPTAERPVRLNRIWLPIAGFLAGFDLLMIIVAATSLTVIGYGGTKDLVIAVCVLAFSIVLFLFRRLVEDRPSDFEFTDDTIAAIMPGDGAAEALTTTAAG
jgi:amino acid transporter